MALITCPECGKTISDKAPACIGCGCPITAINTTPAQAEPKAAPTAPSDYAASRYGDELPRTRRSRRAQREQSGDGQGDMQMHAPVPQTAQDASPAAGFVPELDPMQGGFANPVTTPLKQPAAQAQRQTIPQQPPHPSAQPQPQGWPQSQQPRPQNWPPVVSQQTHPVQRQAASNAMGDFASINDVFQSFFTQPTGTQPAQQMPRQVIPAQRPAQYPCQPGQRQVAYGQRQMPQQYPAWPAQQGQPATAAPNAAAAGAPPAQQTPQLAPLRQQPQPMRQPQGMQPTMGQQVPHPAAQQPSQPSTVSNAAPATHPAASPEQPEKQPAAQQASADKAAAKNEKPAAQSVPAQTQSAPTTEPQAAPETAPTKATKPETKPAKASADRAAAKSDQPAAPTKTVPKEMPEVGLGLGIILELLGKLCGFCGFAGIMALGAMLVDVISGERVNTSFLPEIAMGLGASFVVSHLTVWIKFLRVRRFLRKGGYEPSIQNDTPSLTNTYNAYGLNRSGSMVRYIKRLNPEAAEQLKKAIRQGSIQRWKRRLRFLPYLLVLAACYFFIPRINALPLYSDHALLIAWHVVTLVVMILYGNRHMQDCGETILSVIITVTMLFALFFFVYFDTDIAYHIAICAGVVLAATFIGSCLPAKK